MKGILFTYLLTIGGAAAGLVRPMIGLYVYALFSALRPQVMWGFAGPMQGLSQLVAVPMLIGWAVQGFGSWQFGRSRVMVAWLFAYFGWMLVSAIFALNPDAAWSPIIERAKIVVPFLAGLTLAQTRRDARVVAWILVVSHAYISWELNLRYLDGYNAMAEDGYASMDNNTFAIALVATVGPALFLAMASPRWWMKGIALASAALIIHTVLLSFSRGGLLALIVTGLVAVVVVPKKPAYLGALLLAAVIGFRFAGPEVLARFDTAFAEEAVRDASAQSRVALWQDALDVIGEHPITGVGPGNWPLMVARLGWPVGKQAHSLWLQTGAEIGVPGVLFLLLFYLSGVWRGIGLIRRGKDTWEIACGSLVVTSLSGFMVAAQFVTVEGLEVPFFTMLIAAMTLKVADLPEEVPAGTSDALAAPAPITPSPYARYQP